MKNFKLYFLILIIFSVIARFIAILYFGDNEIEHEWGAILSNLVNHNVLGYRYQLNKDVIPSIFMPPLYPLFLYFLKIIAPTFVDFVNFVLYVQLIISLISIYFFQKLLNLFYGNKTSFLGTTVFAFFPLNVYSVSQTSSVSLQVCVLVVFFYCLISYIRKRKIFALVSFSFLSGLLIHLRGEFFLFYFFSLFYIYLLNKNLKNIILSFILVLIISTPYMIRNYIIFNEIAISKSFGYNLWKGNNSYIEGFNLKGVEGNDKYDEIVSEKIYKLEKRKNVVDKKTADRYEIDRDLIFKNIAIDNIKSEPIKYSKFYLKKFIAYLFVGSSKNEKNNHFLYTVPKLLISISALFGIVSVFRDKKILLNYFSLYYFLNIAFFSIFFILPRYSLIILPIQILLSCYLIRNFDDKF